MIGPYRYMFAPHTLFAQGEGSLCGVASAFAQNQRMATKREQVGERETDQGHAQPPSILSPTRAQSKKQFIDKEIAQTRPENRRQFGPDRNLTAPFFLRLPSRTRLQSAQTSFSVSSSFFFHRFSLRPLGPAAPCRSIMLIPRP